MEVFTDNKCPEQWLPLKSKRFSVCNCYLCSSELFPLSESTVVGMWKKDCYAGKPDTRESLITSSYLSYGLARLAGIPPNVALPMPVAAQTHHQYSLFMDFGLITMTERGLHVVLAPNLIRSRYIANPVPRTTFLFREDRLERNLTGGTVVA